MQEQVTDAVTRHASTIVLVCVLLTLLLVGSVGEVAAHGNVPPFVCDTPAGEVAQGNGLHC